MNERIRELEGQCWEDVPVDIDYDYLSRVRRVFNRGKFAELIVRECANFIDSKLERSNEIYSCADGEDLRQHFGVDQ